MQIAEISKIIDEIEVPNWLEYNPHTSERRRKNNTNTIYVAKKPFEWDGWAATRLWGLQVQ
jgi:hypothetical protein